MNPMFFQATNQTFNNASSAIDGSMANSFGLLGPTFALIVVAVAAVFIGSEVQRIEWLHQKLKAFSQTLHYTVIGLAASIVVGVLVAPMYYLSQTDGQTQTYVLYAVGGLIGAYIVFTVLGYVVDHLILSNVREYRDQLDVEVSDD